MQIVHNSTAYELANRFATQALAHAQAVSDGAASGVPLAELAPRVAQASQAARDAAYSLKFVHETMTAGAWMPAGLDGVQEGVRMLHAVGIRIGDAGQEADARNYLCQAIRGLGAGVRETTGALDRAKAEEAGAANAVAALNAAVAAGR
ncbi:MAG: hypothetical protein JWM86_800 [Thermoleophilia bacterium]|nr:hypothetical protein [Thermoleophilia bacterium]